MISELKGGPLGKQRLTFWSNVFVDKKCSGIRRIIECFLTLFSDAGMRKAGIEYRNEDLKAQNL